MTSRITFDRSSWLSWTALSLGCLSGCASWDQVTQSVRHPWQATDGLMARTSDRVEGLSEKGPKQTRHAATLSPQQLANQTTSPAKPAVPPTNTPAPAATKPLTPAPANVELLPAPPVSPTSAIIAAPSTPAAVAPANTTWCRVRVRNIGSQPATQVAVTISSPENASLVSKEGDSISRPVTGKMEFAPVAQVGANEEVVLLVGVATADERANRLRVQVRDGQGGTNQELQARWKVAIEAME